MLAYKQFTMERGKNLDKTHNFRFNQIKNTLYRHNWYIVLYPY